MNNLYQGNKRFTISAIQNIFHGLLDIIYPRYCFVCNKSLHDEESIYICKTCLENIKDIDIKRCNKCGFKMAPGVISSRNGCFECKNANLRFDRGFFVSDYDGPLKSLIHQYKYNKQEFLAKLLGDLSINHLLPQDIIPEIDIVVPVPLHWRKKMERGFNQSELIAKRICKKQDMPFSKNNLCRIKYTLSQIKLTRSQRQTNVSGAFRVKQPKMFYKKRVLLVDDVLTTGITASECSKTLKKAGVRKVYLFALARAKR